MRTLAAIAFLALTACANADQSTVGSAIDMQGSGLTAAEWGAQGVNVRAAGMKGVGQVGAGQLGAK